MTGSPPRLWDLTGAEIELDGGPISACAINVNDADVDIHSRHRSASTTRSPATSALNNCFNAIAMHARDLLDYLVPSSFGNLELRPRADTEFIGQPIDYSAGKTVAIQKISIDAMALPRRPHQTRRAGHGARGTRRRAAAIARCHPIFLLESRKAGHERLRTFLDGHGYKGLEAG